MCDLCGEETGGVMCDLHQEKAEQVKFRKRMKARRESEAKWLVRPGPRYDEAFFKFTEWIGNK